MCFEIIAKGFGETGKLIASFQKMSDQLAKGADVANQLVTQEQIEAAEIWDRIPMVEQIASRLCLEPSEEFSNLSAGLKRRVLRRALVSQPDLLLLTNPPTTSTSLPYFGWRSLFSLSKALSSL